MEIIKTKKVVIRVDEEDDTAYHGGLLPDFWIKEFCNRIGRECFLYYYGGYLIGYRKCNAELNKEYGYCTNSFISSKDLGDVVSEEDVRTLMKNGTVEFISAFYGNLSREDENLIEIVEEIDKPNSIRVVEIPYDVDYYIEEYDNCNGECITEQHRTWTRT